MGANDAGSVEVEGRVARPRLDARDRKRAQEIVRTLLPFVLSLRRDQRRWLKWGRPVPRSAAFHERRAAEIVQAIAGLGPTFVKLAQIFAARADLIPEPYLSALGTLTDRVPPEPWVTIHDALTEAWGQPPEQVLDALDSEPLAAGSLGQVHRARYRGRDVVVKVLRPRVAEIVAQDVRIARWIVEWMYSRFPHHHVLGFRVVLEEFARHVPEEMDFVREAMQCARMRERFADEPRLRIPRVERGLTRPNVVVLEYLPGTRIDMLDARIASGELTSTSIVETLIESYARMMLRDGVFHADPHPGNLLIDEQGRIILLDFGMVIEVNVAIRKALFDTIVAAVARDPEKTADGFHALGLVVPGTPRETIRALVDELLTLAYQELSMQERARVLADRVMRELFNWPIVLPGELVYFARTAALIEGIGARYDRNFNSIRIASPVVVRLRRELLVALLGEEHAKDPVMSVAATVGAFVGGASALIAERWRRLIGGRDAAG